MIVMASHYHVCNYESTAVLPMEFISYGDFLCSKEGGGKGGGGESGGLSLTGQCRQEGSWEGLGSGEVRITVRNPASAGEQAPRIRRFPSGGTAHCYATI